MGVSMKCKSAIFIGLLLIIFTSNGYAQTKDSSEPQDGQEILKSPLDDSSENNGGILKKDLTENDTILKWKQSRDFTYMHYLDSLLRKQKDIKSDTVRFDESSGKIIRNQKPETGGSPFGSILNSLPFRIFFWILAVIFISFISYKVLFKNGIFGRRKNKLLSQEENESLDDLQNMSEYDTLISNAETKHDFNLAIRFLFLKTLKNLSDRGFVSFTIGKTNKEYLKEMQQTAHFKEFEDLTRNYEYVWYGKHLIYENQYVHLKELFYLFNKKI
jgi:hypothetical protein